MLRSLALTALIGFCTVAEGFACSMGGLAPDDIIENAPVYSAGRRMCVIVRRYPGIPDFTGVRAGTYLAADDSDDDPPTTYTAALYDTASGPPRLRTEIAIDAGTSRQVLLSDSGQYVVGILRRDCRFGVAPEEAFVAIYRANGDRIATLRTPDLFAEFDAFNISRGTDFGAEIRTDSSGRELLVLSLRGVDRRVDLETGALLDEKRPIFPAPRAYATPFAVTDVIRPYGPPPPDCAAAFADKGLVRVDSKDLFAHAIDAPAPSFPFLAFVARMRGTVAVQVVVSESGEVSCVRNTASIFGLNDAAVAAARHWTFKRFIVRGHVVKVVSEILFHFDDAADAE